MNSLQVNKALLMTRNKNNNWWDQIIMTLSYNILDLKIIVKSYANSFSFSLMHCLFHQDEENKKKTILLVNFTRDFTVVTLHCGGVIVQSKRRVRQQRQSQTNRKEWRKKITRTCIFVLIFKISREDFQIGWLFNYFNWFPFYV